MDRDTLLRELKRSGQEHIARHLHTLPAEPRERLERQLESFDYALVRQLTEIARSPAPAVSPEAFEPAPVVRADRPADDIAAARRVGEDALRAGEVAVFIVAGGQGSRLGFDGPKGRYPIGPLSGKSLFQIHAERVLASHRRYGGDIPLYVMTCETNDADTRAFFADHAFFGLPPASVHFCLQRMLPAFDPAGRFLLDAPDHVFVSPDGHGGSYHALRASGALAEMAGGGIRHLSYLQVDNPLATAVDPLFIGEHVRTASEFSSKVLRKRDPQEKLGMFVVAGDRVRVIEYSEMPPAMQEERLPDGSLRYAFGSIAIHVIDVDFAARMAEADLPFHVARKPVPHLDAAGRLVEPAEPNAAKFERFVFDAVPHARSVLTMEVRREDEFAPVKNATGDDSPETARAALMAQHRRWLRQAGKAAPEDLAVEISPLFALDAEELRRKADAIHVHDGLHLE